VTIQKNILSGTEPKFIITLKEVCYVDLSSCQTEKAWQTWYSSRKVGTERKVVKAKNKSKDAIEAG
jgi:hypothetical protein